MAFKDHIDLDSLISIINDTDGFIETVNEFGHCSTNEDDNLYISDKMKELKQIRENYSILLDELNDKMVECYGN